jgi:hypothetical protein
MVKRTGLNDYYRVVYVYFATHGLVVIKCGSSARFTDAWLITGANEVTSFRRNPCYSGRDHHRRRKIATPPPQSASSTGKAQGRSVADAIAGGAKISGAVLGCLECCVDLISLRA